MVTVAIWMFILLAIAVVGHLFKMGFITMLAGFGLVIYGFTLWDLGWYFSVIIMLVGAFTVWKGARD
jgi:hypothetical protein